MNVSSETICVCEPGEVNASVCATLPAGCSKFSAVVRLSRSPLGGTFPSSGGGYHKYSAKRTPN